MAYIKRQRGPKRPPDEIDFEDLEPYEEETRDYIDPCPFCGTEPDDGSAYDSDATESIYIGNADYSDFTLDGTCESRAGYYQVGCFICGASGPVKETEREAVEAWNATGRAWTYPEPPALVDNTINSAPSSRVDISGLEMEE